MKNFSIAITMLICFVAFGQEKNVIIKTNLIIKDVPSVNKYDEPIYVVDGKIVSAEKVKKINNDLIESITILKNDSTTFFCSGRKNIIVIKTKKLSKRELKKMKKE